MPTKGKAKTQKAKAPVPAKKRSSAPIPDDKWFYPSWFFLNPTLSGIEVNEDTAKRFSAVFGCVKAISETLASIPILTYRRLPNGGKERALTHRVSKLLRLRPNRWQTSSTFRQFMFAHALTWGNAYAEIVRSAAGDPEELLILHPSLVTVHVSDTGFVYYVVRNPRTGATRVVFKRDMFHLLGPTDDGITGYSPITAMREGIGLGMAAEAFGAGFFGNGATPAAVVEYPGDIAPEQVDQFKAKLEELYKGPRKAGKVGVLTSGMTIKTIGIPQKDAEWIDLRRFQIEEIARIYRVPLYKLQDHTHSTFSNIEHLAIEWVSDCLMPWARRFEEAVTRDLFNPEATLDEFSDEYFTEFLFDGLLRGDTQSRYNAYAVGRQWGWLSVNDVREKENQNPIGPEGDVYLQPLNMVPAGTEAEAPKQGGNDEQAEDEDDGTPEAEELDNGQEPGERSDQLPDETEAQEAKVKAAFRGAFRETWLRIVRKELGAVKTSARKKGEAEFDAWFSDFLDEHREFALDCLREMTRAYASMRGMPEPDEWARRIVDEYRAEVQAYVTDWRSNPETGCVRMDSTVCDYRTDRLLNYTGIQHGQAA